MELVDAVLAETRTVQQRLRCLPSRVGVYFLLALFPSLGYLRVWDKLTAGLRGREVRGKHRPGTRWEDIPDDWSCPDCGAAKADFQMAEASRA